MNGTRLRKALSRAITKVRDDRIYGTLGRLNGDGTYTIRVAERPSYVYVRMEDGTLTSLPNIGKGRVQERATLPVQMMRLHNGELVLDGQDNRLLEDDTGEPDNPYGVPAHPISIHTDVDIDTPTTGQALVYDGTAWVNDTVLADVGAAIEAAAAKTTPVDADDFGITDSAAANVLKKLSWANAKATLKTYFDTLYELAGAIATHAALTVTHGATGAVAGTTNAQTLQNKTLDSTNISTLTAKNPPVDADSAVIVDSAAANVFKAVTYTNVKAFLKTYFDTLYGLLATANTWTANNAFNSTATTGSALSVTRDLAAASTDAPVVSIVQDNTGDDQIALRVQQDGTGAIIEAYDGATLALRLKDGGNLGLNTTDIETTHANFGSIQLGNGGYITYGKSGGSSGVSYAYNAYYDGAWKRRNNGDANLLEQSASGTFFYWALTDGTDLADSVIDWEPGWSIGNTGGVTIVDPIISDFTNAQHDHGDANDGGGILLPTTLTLSGILTLTPASATIAAGVITATATIMQIDTEAAAATDDLVTISAGEQGQIIIIKTISAARDVVIKHNTGNIVCGADRTLSAVQDTWMGVYLSTSWRQLAFNDNL